MSHMLDCQLFGLKPGAHHFVNVLLHSASVVLLFLLLAQISPSSPRDESVRLADRTGIIWSSVFVAAIFAIHPLHVESVAWISERKDVLSGLFFFLTLLAYFSYTRKPNVGRYLTMSILFACGLMSKPMLVTLPIILLLLDYWPLNRCRRSDVGDRNISSANWVRLVVEKIPLFVLSIASAAVTLVVQNEGVGLVRLEVLPLSWRITNALSAYLVYIWQMFWPANLALAYGHPGELSIWQTAGAAALLIAITLSVFIVRKRSPYLVVGWCWYLVMLLSVIGLIQVGGQAHADRYAYLPQIGLCIAAAWGIADLSISWRYRREILGAAVTIVMAALAWRAGNQVWYWHDSERLWRHALAVTTQNEVAHLGLARFFLEQKRVEDGIAEYESAAKIGQSNPDIETTLANLLLEQGRIEEAIQYYRDVVQLQPSSALAHYNLAAGLHRLGRLSEAIIHYKEALAIDPGYPDAESLLGQALLQNGQADEAKVHLDKR
jgi:tetratricopeptide (TPR) repeat protein